MKAVRLDACGPPENLRIVDAPCPEPGEYDVLIRVACAGLLYADVEQRKGSYYLPTRLPFFPGREVAGTIERVGRKVAYLRPGMRVAALLFEGGGYAQYALAPTHGYTLPNGTRVPASDIVELPERVGFSQALVYLVNFRLAHLVFHALAAVPPGATVLVHGAAGAFASVLTRIASEHGATVIATARTEQELALARANGAAHGISLGREDYVQRVRELTGGAGVDYSLNGVGGETVQRDAAALRTFGEAVLYGYAAGKAAVDLYAVGKCVRYTSFSADDFLSTPAFARADAAMRECFETRPLLDAATVFELAQVVEAHRAMETGRTLGKVVLAMPDAISPPP